MMAVAQRATQPPIHANFLPASTVKAPMVPNLAFFPNENSRIIKGTDQRMRKQTQAIRKLPPPWVAAIRGNRQILPVPTAIPMVARTKPQRLVNCSEALIQNSLKLDGGEGVPCSSGPAKKDSRVGPERVVNSRLRPDPAPGTAP